MKTNWKKALIVSLVGIGILASGNLVLDCIQYHTTSVFLNFLENQPPQIKTDPQTIDSVRETGKRIQDKIETDTPMLLLAVFGLWCVPRALKEK
jgi:hypothetical protein